MGVAGPKARALLEAFDRQRTTERDATAARLKTSNAAKAAGLKSLRELAHESTLLLDEAGWQERAEAAEREFPRALAAMATVAPFVARNKKTKPVEEQQVIVAYDAELTKLDDKLWLTQISAEFCAAVQDLKTETGEPDIDTRSRVFSLLNRLAEGDWRHACSVPDEAGGSQTSFLLFCAPVGSLQLLFRCQFRRFSAIRTSFRSGVSSLLAAHSMSVWSARGKACAAASSLSCAPTCWARVPRRVSAHTTCRETTRCMTARSTTYGCTAI
jgi:hypothetical protein